VIYKFFSKKNGKFTCVTPQGGPRGKYLARLSLKHTTIHNYRGAIPLKATIQFNIREKFKLFSQIEMVPNFIRCANLIEMTEFEKSCFACDLSKQYFLKLHFATAIGSRPKS